METKNEEKETAGIRKKDVDVKRANSRLLYNFFEITHMKYKIDKRLCILDSSLDLFYQIYYKKID